MSAPGDPQLRVAIVQTTPTVSAEVSVLLTMLRAIDARSPDRPEILLLQGVDSREPYGHQAAEAFAGLAGVTTTTFEVGGLGRPSRSRPAQALKVLDVARLYRSRHEPLRAVADFAPNVVYSAQQRWDQRIARRVARVSQLPRVVHLHYRVGPWLGSSAVRALLHAEMVLAVSDFIRNDAIAAGVRSGRVHTIRNAVADSLVPLVDRSAARQAMRRELSIEENDLLVGMVGRLCRDKGQLELLDALVPLMRSDRSLHLVFAGREYPPGNGISNKLMRRARASEIASQVHLLGHRDDVARVLDALDVFAHPSRAEPFGLAILEAMARGLPVVAWGEGGPVEVISAQETGILVPPMRIPALTEAIGDLLRDDARRGEMGAAARERVHQDFRADESAKLWVQLLSMASRGQEGRCPAVTA